MPTTEPTLRLGRNLAQARGALIFIHGRGSAPEDIVGLADALDAQDFAQLAPRANGGSWYPQRFLAPLQENEPWLSSALDTLNGLVREIRAAGISTDRIGLVGFSQGACLALEYAVRTGRRYGFVASLSGALIGPLDTARPAHDLQGTPVLLGCAEADAHIPREYVQRSVTALRAVNATVTEQVYPGSAHRIFPDEVAWINQQIVSLRR